MLDFSRILHHGNITRYRVIVGDPPADRTRVGYMILGWILFRV